jgi:hypothetical protein
VKGVSFARAQQLTQTQPGSRRTAACLVDGLCGLAVTRSGRRRAGGVVSITKRTSLQAVHRTVRPEGLAQPLKRAAQAAIIGLCR